MMASNVDILPAGESLLTTTMTTMTTTTTSGSPATERVKGSLLEEGTKSTTSTTLEGGTSETILTAVSSSTLPQKTQTPTPPVVSTSPVGQPSLLTTNSTTSGSQHNNSSTGVGESHSTGQTAKQPQQEADTSTDQPSPPKVNELTSPNKLAGTNQNNSGNSVSSTSHTAMRNNTSSSDGGLGGGGGSAGGTGGTDGTGGTSPQTISNRDSLKQRKIMTDDPSSSAGSNNPIHHIAASGSPTLLGAGQTTAGTETGRRTSTTNTPAATNNPTTSRNTTKPCCFCWCCCYRCTCLSSRNQEEELSKSKDITSRDSWSNDPEVTPSVEEIRCWGDSFDRLMKSPMGRAVFREFLKCEYSEENILFWLACEDLKKDNNPEVVEEKARLIYEDYISILSPKEVSLDSRVREIVNRNMVDPTPHTFDEAQLQIYTLMHRDSYPRFVNSTYYKKLAQLSSTSRKESSA